MDDTLSASEPRLAANYRLVYDLLRKNGQGRHLSMPEVHALTRAHQPAIGFTTVYRALVRLREMGLVSEIQVPGAENAYYEVAEQPHAHFRCSGCGRVEDVPFALSGDVLASLASQLHAHVAGASVSLHGRCAACTAPA